MHDLRPLPFRRWKEEMTSLSLNGSMQARLGEAAVTYTDVGAGAPVLFSHASATGCSLGPITFDWLVSDGYRVLTPSRNGYPGTPVSLGASPEQQADVYARFLDLLGVRRAALISWSGGGPSAVCFAIRHPDRCAGLISYCSATHRWQQRVKPMERVFMNDRGMWLMYRYMARNPGAALKAGAKAMGLDPGYVLGDPGRLDKLIEFQMAMTPYSIRKDGVLADMREDRAMPRYDVERIACPTLAVHSENDAELPISNAEFLSENVPGAELLRLQRGGHHPLIDSQGDIVRERMRALLARCEW
jgi:pimeloyl-ACP methyl ester carboxylesterase